MSFDRLAPAKRSSIYSCVRKTQQEYRVLAVPPSLTIINDGDDYQHVTGWAEALDNCPDMADGRRDYLKNELLLLSEKPERIRQHRRQLALATATMALKSSDLPTWPI
jgi:hypothetical protein